METPRRYATDGTWNHVWIVILAEADEAGEIDWTMSVGFPIAGQHFGVMVQAVGHDCGYDVVGEDLILATTTQMRGDQQGSPRLVHSEGTSRKNRWLYPHQMGYLPISMLKLPDCCSKSSSTSMNNVADHHHQPRIRPLGHHLRRRYNGRRFH